MIGGEEEDLDALIEECGAMIDGPRMTSQETEQRPLASGSAPRDDSIQLQPVRANPTQAGEGSLATSLDKLLKQNSELITIAMDKRELEEEIQLPAKRKSSWRITE